MNQCAVYINKLDEYRKNVNRKIKTGQIDDLYKSSSRPFEKELEELYHNFDKAFLNLYPNFVEKFNSLLKPEERYKLEKVLHEARVFITPGFIFGSNGARYIRISLCCKDNKLAEALERIKRI